MLAAIRFLATGCCVAAAAAAHAQPSPAAPLPNSPAAAAMPQAGGLRPIFPSGLGAGSGARQSSDPIAAGSMPVPPSSVVPGTGPAVGGGGGVNNPQLPEAPGTNVLGAGASVRGPSQDLSGAGGYAAADEARSFFFADANKDGELTRGEAGRLSIRSQSFEEMDRNFDGVITRFEYEDSLR